MSTEYQSLAHLLGAVGHFAAHGRGANTAGLFVFDREVIIDVAILGLGADLAASHAQGRDRVRVAGPVDHINVVSKGSNLPATCQWVLARLP